MKKLVLFSVMFLISFILAGCTQVKTDDIIYIERTEVNGVIVLNCSLGVDNFKNSQYGIDVEDGEMPFIITWTSDSVDNISVAKGSYNYIYTRFNFKVVLTNEINQPISDNSIILTIKSRDNKLTLIRVVDL